MNLIVLQSHVQKPLRKLLKLQADTTGVSGSTYMEEVACFLGSDALQEMIDSLQTAICIIENEKMTPGATEIIK